MPAKKKDAVGIAEAPEPIRSMFATVTEAKTLLHVSRAHVYSLMERGELKYVKFGECRRIPWAALREFAEKGTVAGIINPARQVPAGGAGHDTRHEGLQHESDRN